MIEVGLSRVELVGRHGVSEEERERPQRFVFDVSIELDRDGAAETDRLEDTVDYSEACDIIALAATERSYKTLERLAQVIGERLAERFGCESVRVRAAKPEPPLPLALEEVAVEVVHERPDEEEDREAEEE